MQLSELETSSEPSPSSVEVEGKPLLNGRIGSLQNLFVRKHRHYCGCFILLSMIAAVGGTACFGIFTYPFLQAEHNSLPSQPSSEEIALRAGDRFLVGCYNSRDVSKNIEFDRTSRSTSLSVYVEKLDNLTHCQTHVEYSNKIFSSVKGQCQTINMFYVVEDALLNYHIWLTSGNPSQKPFTIVVCQKNLSLYEQFTTECVVNDEDCEYHDLPTNGNGQIDFQIEGKREPVYKFVGVIFKEKSELKVNLEGTKTEYVPFDKCHFCRDLYEEDCSAPLDDSEKTLCILVELKQCEKTHSLDTSGTSDRVGLDHCDSVVRVEESSNSDEITTLSYTTTGGDEASLKSPVKWAVTGIGILLILTACVLLVIGLVSLKYRPQK